jgi:hypothetical protein
MAISTYIAAISARSPLLIHRWSDSNEAEEQTRRVHIATRDPRSEAEKVAYINAEGQCWVPGVWFGRMIAEIGGGHKQRGSRKSMKYIIPAAITVIDEEIILRGELGEPLTNFEVDSRPVVIPATKGRIMRHRPRFNDWHCEFSIEIDLELIEPGLVHQFIVEGGSKNGLGDFRPQKGGSFGRFSLVSWAQLNEVNSTTMTTLPKSRAGRKVAA